MTKADREVFEEAESLHVGPVPPEVRMYLGVNKELLSQQAQRSKKLSGASPRATGPEAANK
jgi:hypothetical protein